MDNLSVTITITGTHDGQAYSHKGGFTANVRSASKFSRDLTDTFADIYSGAGAISFAIIENTGSDDAFVFIGRISTCVPAGKTIVITGSVGENSGSITMYAGYLISAKSRTSAGTRINCLVAY